MRKSRRGNRVAWPKERDWQPMPLQTVAGISDWILSEAPFFWFQTLTFARDVSVGAAQRVYRAFTRLLDSTVGSILRAPPSPKRVVALELTKEGRIHLHALQGGTGYELLHDGQQKSFWKAAGGGPQVLVEEVETLPGVVEYLCKDLVFGRAHISLCELPPREQDRLAKR